MTRIGFFVLPSAGHLYPAMALGRRLAQRKHQVVFFNYLLTKALIKKAGFEFYPLAINTDDSPPRAGVETGLSSTSRGLQFGARTILSKAPRCIQEAGIDALIVDQMDLASGTVAEYLGLPFISLAILPPAFLDSSVPPIGFSWKYRKGILAHFRNRIGNSILCRFLAPVLSLINRQRNIWGMPTIENVNDIFSKLAIITQVPESFDFPFKHKPAHLFYTGPFIDEQVRRATQFPWNHLDTKPLIYASMGTLRNNSSEAFRIIAESCKSFDVQLVLSLGGSQEIGSLPGDAIIVPFAPQLELIRRASMVITHAGINTTLESLAHGVPLIAIPVSDDQPSVAARIHRIGAGKAIPHHKLTVLRLSRTIRQILESDRFKAAACRMQDQILKTDALNAAADIVERAFHI